MGNPAEETCCYPNEANVTSRQPFVNIFPSDGDIHACVAFCRDAISASFTRRHFSIDWAFMVGLEAIALFRNLSQEELQALRRITQERQFAAGSEIFREGAPGDGVYFVKEGSVEISGRVGGDTRRVFSRLGPGEIFGEMAVIEQLPRSAIAMAFVDTRVYFIPRGEMLSLIERSPALAFNLLQLISQPPARIQPAALARTGAGRKPRDHRTLCAVHRPRSQKPVEHHQPLVGDVQFARSQPGESAPNHSSASANRLSASTTWSVTS